MNRKEFVQGTENLSSDLCAGPPSLCLLQPEKTQHKYANVIIFALSSDLHGLHTQRP